MSTATVDVRNPVSVRDAGLKALNDALGPEGAQAFIDQYEGIGDFTREKYELPDEPFEEYTARLKRIDSVIRAHREAGGPTLANGMPDISFGELTAKIRQT